MKRGILVLILTCLAMEAVVALEDLTIQRSVFIPGTFYVGDLVELRLTFQTPLGKLRVSDSLDQPDWGIVHEVVLTEHDGIWDARIRFTPYAPGTLSIPPISLGPVSIEGLIVHVRSVLDNDNREPATLRSQTVLPQTWLLLVLQVLAALVLGLALWWLWTFLWPLGQRYLQIRQARKPGRTFKKFLQDMRHRSHGSQDLDFYGLLMSETRLYFTDRLKIPAISATSSELLGLVSSRLRDISSLELLAELLGAADKVRFSGAVISAEGMSHHIEVLLVIVDQVETILSADEKLLYVERIPKHVDP